MLVLSGLEKKVSTSWGPVWEQWGSMPFNAGQWRLVGDQWLPVLARGRAVGPSGPQWAPVVPSAR